MGKLRVGSLLSLVAAVLCFWQHALADTVIIEKVVCSHVATGVDEWALNGAAALGALLAASNKTNLGGFNPLKCPDGSAAPAAAAPAAPATRGTLVGSGLTAAADLPITQQDVITAANCGAGHGEAALNYLDKLTSGTDDLIINVNGHQVFPEGEGHSSISAGQTITPNVQFDFDGGCRIQLIEYDSGSDNDDLGFIDVNPAVKPGEDYKVEDALVFNKVEGDLYKVTYRVERNDKGKDAKMMLCGVAACKECANKCCTDTSHKGLDRDGDKGDLKACPPSFVTSGWKKYDMIWPFSDVYLRICGKAEAGTCSKKRDDEEEERAYDGWRQRLITALRGELKRKIQHLERS